MSTADPPASPSIPSARLAPLAAPVSITSTKTENSAPSSMPSGRVKESSVTTPDPRAPHTNRAATATCPPNLAALPRPSERRLRALTRSSKNPMAAIPNRATMHSAPPMGTAVKFTAKPSEKPTRI